MNALAYGITDAAEAAGVSETLIRRALKATDPRAFPPPLRAKRVGNAHSAKQIILASELTKWLDRFPDS